MTVQEVYQRYPKIDQIVSLANESREHSPSIARICDFLAGLCVDLFPFLPQPVAEVKVAPPAPASAPAPVAPAWMPPPVGQPGMSPGWPQPAPPPAPPPAWMSQAPAITPAPVDEKAEIRALLAAIAAKL